ncbi:MAG: hypothetical protein IT462_03660 [Planctomycetes bacterium]|nr:hypothetical protein [Planctomycetota bacterium]
MRIWLSIALITTVALLATACRIGGGFDGEGRLISREGGESPAKTQPVTPAKTDPAKTAPQPATIVYLIPAG